MSLDPLSAVLDVGGKIIDKIWPDKNEAEKARVKLAELAQAGEFKEIELILKQIEVNAIEAQHESIFVAGWRPGIGWICGASLFYHYILEPFLFFVLTALDVHVILPALDTSELMTILLGILGLGAFRSYDKKQGGNGSKS